MSSTFLNKLCSIATIEHYTPLPLENYLYIVALTPTLEIVSVFGTTEFLYHSSTIERLLLRILKKDVIPELFISPVNAVARRFIQGRYRIGTLDQTN